MLNNIEFDLWADGYDKTVGISDEENTYPFAGYKKVLGFIFQTITGAENAVVLEGLDGDENPLPDAYQISMHDLSKYDETIQQIQAIEGVDHYTDYSDIATKLSNIDMIVRVASLAIIVILAIVSLFIISNTVKVTMFSRRTEISIMKSVGATNGFVRIPFIVEGLSLIHI